MKPIVSVIAAMDEKRGVGKDNKIPWHIREDLVHLKKLTLGNVVILGRKTYESMAWYYDKSGREMPGKLYIVITRDVNFKPTRQNATTASSLEEALDKSKGEKEVFINGGAQIFAEAIEKKLADRLYLTIVKGDFGADAFFPEYSEFTKEVFHQKVSENGYDYEFIDLIR